MGVFERLTLQNAQWFSALPAKFPTRKNREFFPPEQGISGKDQGFEAAQFPLFATAFGMACWEHKTRAMQMHNAGPGRFCPSLRIKSPGTRPGLCERCQ